MQPKDPWGWAEGTFEDKLPFSVYNVVSGASVEIILQRYPLVVTDVVNGEVFKLMVKACETVLDGKELLFDESIFLALGLRIFPFPLLGFSSPVKKKIQALLEVPKDEQTLKLEGDLPFDSAILCEIQLLDGGALSLSYDKRFQKEPSSLIRFTISPNWVNDYSINVEKKSRTDALFERISVLEGIERRKLRFLYDDSGERVEERLRFSACEYLQVYALSLWET